MTDIVKLAYNAGKRQALVDLGLVKESGYKDRFLAWMGDAAAASRHAKEVAGAASSKAVGAEKALVDAKKIRDAAEIAQMQAMQKAEMGAMSPEKLLDLQAGKIQLSPEYVAIRDRHFPPPPTPVTPPTGTTPPGTTPPSGPSFWDRFKEEAAKRPLTTTALGVGAAGAGTYGLYQANRPDTFGEKLQNLFS